MMCPVCKGSLVMRQVAPCYGCGHEQSELAELARGEHTYNLFKIYGQEVVLCDFCEADFDSYDYDYLGVPEESANNYPLELIAKVEDPRPEQDAVCLECEHRLAYLTFLKNVRDYHSA